MPKVKVKKVIDGDTFQTERGRFIRLAEVEAPELEERGGKKAKQELEKLIKGEEVTYEQVGTSFGRAVARVKVGGKSVNKAMRDKGCK